MILSQMSNVIRYIHESGLESSKVISISKIQRLTDKSCLEIERSDTRQEVSYLSRNVCVDSVSTKPVLPLTEQYVHTAHNNCAER